MKMVQYNSMKKVLYKVCLQRSREYSHNKTEFYSVLVNN